MITIPIKKVEGQVELFDKEGDFVGKVNTKTGKAIIGDAFWRKERTCRMVQSADFDLLVCDECHRIEEKNLLFAPSGKIEFDGKYCPGCGAMVIGC